MKGLAKHRRLIWFLIALACVIVARKALDIREDNAERAQLDLANLTGIPVAVRYKGHYTTARTTIPPRGAWNTPFREWDVLVIEATYAGLALSNSVFLTTTQAPTRQPRLVHHDLYVVREIRSHESGQPLEAIVVSPDPRLQAQAKPGRARTNIVCW